MEATRDIRFNDLKNTFNTQHLFSKTKGDKVIWALVVLLTLVSLLAVYSATGSLAYKNYKGNTEIYLFKQVAFILAGIMVIYFAHLVNYTFYSKAARFVFLLSIPLLFSSYSIYKSFNNFFIGSVSVSISPAPAVINTAPNSLFTPGRY